jgi:hypothetical protein
MQAFEYHINVMLYFVLCCLVSCMRFCDKKKAQAAHCETPPQEMDNLFFQRRLPREDC